MHGASPGFALKYPGRHWRYMPPLQVLVSLPDPPQHSCHGVVEPPPHTEELPQPQLPPDWLPIGSMPHFSAAGREAPVSGGCPAVTQLRVSDARG